jgi:phosphatidylglycerophosphate synthase
MIELPPRLWLVQAISLSRLFAALAFASIAFQDFPLTVGASLYCWAALSDLLDGYLARKLAVTTHLGSVLDLLSDKSLTIVSLLYAAALGIPILPLALIGVRELITLGARIVIVHGQPLLPTNRTLGGIMALSLWGSTLLLFLKSDSATIVRLVFLFYCVCATVVAVNLVARVILSYPRIKSALKSGL